MPKLFLILAIAIIAIACIQSLYIHTVGLDPNKHYAPSLRAILNHLSDKGLDITFDKQMQQYREFSELANGVLDDLKALTDEFKEADRTFFDDIVTGFKVFFNSIFAILEILVIGLFKILGGCIGFIADLIECILWLMSIAWYLIVPLPIA